jgi:hypothetical protein
MGGTEWCVARGNFSLATKKRKASKERLGSIGKVFFSYGKVLFF